MKQHNKIEVLLKDNDVEFAIYINKNELNSDGTISYRLIINRITDMFVDGAVCVNEETDVVSEIVNVEGLIGVLNILMNFATKTDILERLKDIRYKATNPIISPLELFCLVSSFMIDTNYPIWTNEHVNISI